MCFEAGLQPSPSGKQQTPLPTCLPLPRRNAHGFSSALRAPSFLPSCYQRCFCMGEESAAYVSQHLSSIIIPQSTAIGADCSNHHFGAVLAAAAEANQPRSSLEKASSTMAIMKTALPWISICQSYFVKIWKAKKQHLLQYCAPTESVQHQQISRNEASPYCFIHFIPNFYFFKLL